MEKLCRAGAKQKGIQLIRASARYVGHAGYMFLNFGSNIFTLSVFSSLLPSWWKHIYRKRRQLAPVYSCIFFFTFYAGILSNAFFFSKNLPILQQLLILRTLINRVSLRKCTSWLIFSALGVNPFMWSLSANGCACSFYICVPLSLYADVSSTIDANGETIGFLLSFPILMVSQYWCHSVLAEYRAQRLQRYSSTMSSPQDVPHYQRPKQGLFYYVSCPHYLIECFIYLWFLVAAFPVKTFRAPSFMSMCTVFVIISQWINYLHTRRYYRNISQNSASIGGIPVS